MGWLDLVNEFLFLGGRDRLIGVFIIRMRVNEAARVIADDSGLPDTLAVLLFG